jgi:hypothetical protein
MNTSHVFSSQQVVMTARNSLAARAEALNWRRADGSVLECREQEAGR